MKQAFHCGFILMHVFIRKGPKWLWKKKSISFTIELLWISKDPNILFYMASKYNFKPDQNRHISNCLLYRNSTMYRSHMLANLLGLWFSSWSIPCLHFVCMVGHRQSPELQRRSYVVSVLVRAVYSTCVYRVERILLLTERGSLVVFTSSVWQKM